jgi:hypothetical protein
MKCERCNTKMKIIETTFYDEDRRMLSQPRFPERILLECPRCKSVVSTKYDPRDDY